MMIARLTVVLVAATAAGASADIVQMSFEGVGRGQNVRITTDGTSMNVFAGQLLHEVVAAEGRGAGLLGVIPTFCVDITQHTSALVREYEVVSPRAVPDSRPMGPGAAAAIHDMYARAAGAQLDPGASADLAAAFQLALWEVISDYDPDAGLSSLRLDDGRFRASKTNGAPLSAGITGHLDDLFGAIGSGSSYAGLVGLRSGIAQDQMAVIPSSGSSAALATGILIAIARRRR